MSPFRRIAPRFNKWWHQYVGSLAFLSLIIVTSVGFWNHDRAIRRIEATELAVTQQQAQIASERAARLEYQLSLTRREIEQRARRKDIIDSVRAEILRDAAILSCKRQNMTRSVVREMARADVTFWENTHRFSLAPTMKLDEFLNLKKDQLNAANRAVRNMYVIDCYAVLPQLNRR